MKILDRLRNERGSVRAVAYARFSSDNQREESIDAQLRYIREFARHNEIILVEEYVDRAKSATTDNRPEFQRMIFDSKHRGFDIVLVHKLDRFARNRADSIGYRAELKRSGVSLISVLEQLDEDSPESVIMESVLEAMAEYYSMNLAREVEKGKKESALQGKHVGGRPPLGYDVDHSTMMLVVNEHEAAAVRMIFDMYLSGLGYQSIIQALHVNGFRTKCGMEFGKNSL